MAPLWIPLFNLFRRTARPGRWRGIPRLVPLAVAATLLTTIAPLAGGSATGQDAGSGPRLDVHAWLCPTGVARADFAFAADCTTPVAGADFTYAPPIGAGFPPEGQDSIESQTTGADGGATWDALFDDGPFTIDEDGASLAAQDLAIVDYVVRCTVDGDEATLIEEVEDVGLAGVVVPPVDGLGNDQTIVCNWYHLPADEAAAGSTVTIHAFACPEEFDAGDLETTCPEPAAGASLPVSFGPSGGQETYTAGDAGALTFETPAPSTALYLETGVAYIDCRDGAGDKVAEDGPLPWVRAEPPFHTFDVVADGELTCNWYLPPDAGRVSATPGAYGPRLARAKKDSLSEANCGRFVIRPLRAAWPCVQEGISDGVGSQRTGSDRRDPGRDPGAARGNAARRAERDSPGHARRRRVHPSGVAGGSGVGHRAPG